MINDFSKIGSSIKKQLDSKGMLEQDLAEGLGISEQTIDKIIKGHKAVNVKELTKIADILGIAADELLELTDDNESLSTESEKFEFIDNIIDEIYNLEEILSDMKRDYDRI